MSCDICGRGACIPSFHSLEEQKQFEKVIDAFDRARDLRERTRESMRENDEDGETNDN